MSTELSARLSAQVLGLIALEQRGAFWTKIQEILLSGRDCEEFLENTSLLKDLGCNVSRTDIRNKEKQLLMWQEQGIHCLSYAEGNYPEFLREIHKPPPILFIRGELKSPILQRKAVAIVGSRKARASSRDTAHVLGKELAENRNVVVSGMAYGVDAEAHRGALAAHEMYSTIAVFGCGVDRIYPHAHRKLAEEILESGGLLLSHFPPGTPPLPHNFLDRNRIIAGMSLATVVVQAAKRSGSLSTARYALEEGREVFAVPGDIWDKQSEGSNALIRSGAQVVLGAGDLFDALELDRVAAESEARIEELPEFLKAPLKLLRERLEVSVLEIEEFVQGNQSVYEVLLELEMRGFVCETPDGRYRYLHRSNSSEH